MRELMASLAIEGVDPDLAFLHIEDLLHIVQHGEDSDAFEAGHPPRLTGGGVHRIEGRLLDEEDLSRTDPLKAGDVGAQGIGVDRKIGQRDRGRPGLDGVDILLSRPIPEKSDGLAVG